MQKESGSSTASPLTVTDTRGRLPVAPELTLELDLEVDGQTLTRDMTDHIGTALTDDL